MREREEFGSLVVKQVATKAEKKNQVLQSSRTKPPLMSALLYVTCQNDAAPNLYRIMRVNEFYELPFYDADRATSMINDPARQNLTDTDPISVILCDVGSVIYD